MWFSITLPIFVVHVCFINFHFILYLHKRILQFCRHWRTNIISVELRRGLDPREYNLIGKKLTRDVSIKEQSKGRMLARAERCVISQRRTVCRARLVHVAVHYRFYNQGRGSEPRALVSPPAMPSLTPRELISRTSRSWNTLRYTQKFLIVREIFHADDLAFSLESVINKEYFLSSSQLDYQSNNASFIEYSV